MILGAAAWGVSLTYNRDAIIGKSVLIDERCFSMRRRGTTFTLPSFIATAICLCLTWSTQASAQELTPEQARAIAKEAYIYGFPLVDNYRVLYSYFVDQKSADYKSPWNVLYNNARVFTSADKAIQTANSDTPYSNLGADLRTEPLVITVPAVPKDRYYSLQFIDLYTFNFAYVGSRSTGNKAASYLLVGPSWQGDTPAGIKDVIRSETELAFVLYRTQLFEPDDIENVKKLQAGYKVEPLSAYLGQPSPTAAAKIDFFKPLDAKEQRSSPAFFNELNFLLQFCPMHPSEKDVMARFAKLGIGATGSFDFARLAPELQQAVKDGMADAWKEFDEFKATQLDTGKLTSAEGFGTRAHLQNNYLFRMASAVLGIYGNSKEEAIYPVYFVDSEGEALDAAKGNYMLRFPPDQLPPVNSFWSLTMYELPASLLTSNSIDRYLINSPMLPDLKRDPDGGISLYLQHESPGKELESNWLPAPAGPFFAVMRLYWPKAEALNGSWKSPALERAK